jgi:hypothetical protein
MIILAESDRPNRQGRGVQACLTHLSLGGIKTNVGITIAFYILVYI